MKKAVSVTLVKKLIALTGLLLMFSAVQSRPLPDFTPLVERNAAAVVNISTTVKRNSGQGMPPQLNLPDIPKDSPFYDFFRKFFEEMPENHGGPAPFEKRSSLGSGFILSADGYVITNNHVVDNAEEIIVRLNDRREFEAELIGKDKKSDIAVLKIDGNNLPFVTLGDSEDLKVGEWVLAIGSPFGFDHSVTAGIISAIGRSLPNENYVPFIQTDVAINPGNSGGPLFNLDGKVIGVNSQIYSRTGGFMGLSFAVPVNVMLDVYRQLKDQGEVSRGWLGVLIQDVNAELAESFGMERPMGALVSKVIEDSPAEKAGFEVGDIIVKFDGESVGFSSDLPPMVGIKKVDDRISVEVIRNGERKNLQVLIAQLPDSESGAPGSSTSKPEQKTDNILKMVVKNISDKQREELNVEDHGIIVEQVMDGPAQKAGVRRGDVLLLLNNIKVKDAKHFKQLTKDLPAGKSVPILIQRRGGPIFLAIKIDEKD